jgi:RNA polymerase sigma factor (sigma-70 family)
MDTPAPFAPQDDPDSEDRALATQARGGDRAALEQLVQRHQRWIYNIVRRMTYNPWDAEDATQEVLTKVITRLSTYEGRSSFRTWLYRIVVNHVLNMRRGRSETRGLTFQEYDDYLRKAPDGDAPDRPLLLEEARVACTTAMLLCLDREQRLVIILAEVLGIGAPVGAELLDVSPDNFRQRLARARKDLYSFLHGKCGLVDPANPCRCSKKTAAFIKDGYVRPERPAFVTSRVQHIRDVVPGHVHTLEALDDGYGTLFDNELFLESPDFVPRLRGLLDSPALRSLLDT